MRRSPGWMRSATRYWNDDCRIKKKCATVSRTSFLYKSELSAHEHLTVEPISHGFQSGREHGAQPGWAEITERLSIRACPSLLKDEEIGKRNDLRLHATYFRDLCHFSRPVRETG